MIGGIIVLGLFLTALAAMVVVSQQYDSYQVTVNKMAQKDLERFSEKLQVLYPGVSFPGIPVSCAGSGSCNQFTITIKNLASVGTQIARIYINSTAYGCNSLCILDPASSARSSSFMYSDRFINPLEPNHPVTFWLDSSILFTNEVPNMISIVTTRGRVFSFQFPIPPSGGNQIPSGALYLGCISINFEPNLVTYTSVSRIVPPKPIASGWQVPYNTYLIFYVRVHNICTARVKLLDRSALTAIIITGTATFPSNQGFYLISPMSMAYCAYFPGSYCIPTSAGNTAPVGSSVQAYNATASCGSLADPCYILPAAASQGEQGQSTYLLFSADGLRSGIANKFTRTNVNYYIAFLAMFWKCIEDTDPKCGLDYEFGVTLPFITFQTFAGP